MKKILELLKKLFTKINIKRTNDIVPEKMEHNNFELEILTSVNNYRKELNLPLLKENTLIKKVCYDNNIRMINNNQLNHNGATIRFEQIQKICNATTVLENLGYNFNTVSGVTNAWINSPTHLKNLVSTDITDFAISVETNVNNKNFFTMMFAKVKSIQ